MTTIHQRISPPRRLRGAHLLVVAAVLLLIAGAGCGRRQAPPTPPRFKVHPDYDRLSRAELLIESQRKPVMGRKQSLAHVRRTVEAVGPLVAEAVKQPEIEADLRALAAEAGTPVEKLRAELQSLQEADLLLESGGDPNAVSSAGAVGVAQWLADTARRAGLRVDREEYGRIVTRGRRVRAEIESARRRPPEWQERLATGTAPVPRDEWIARQTETLRELERRRLAADERYDPRKAIFAQTRHLVRTRRRFGRLDWALQAYHGGVRGAERTIALYLDQPLSAATPASVSFEEVYFGLSPRGRPRAFSYVYGRADDHRYYWWRVLAAERALALYRAEPERFRAWWRALAPGYPMDRVWYPDALEKPYADAAALRAALRSGELVPIPDDAARHGFAPRGVAPLDRANERWYRAVRPEALGMLKRLVATYREEGGSAPLRVTGAASTVAYAAMEAGEEKGRTGERENGPAAPGRDAERAKGAGVPVTPSPPHPLTPSLPPPLTLHAAGLCIDVAQPETSQDRKVLEYALSQLGDRMRIAWLRDASAGGYHLCPNPAFAQEMRAAAR